jgi:glycosyltransferase involved in cell wall biosynthesis
MPGSGKVKVGFVIWSLGLGGAERVIMQLATGVNRQKFEPVILCLNDAGPFAAEMEENGISVHAFNKRGAVDFKMLFKMIKFIRTEKIQILHTHLWGANVWGRLAARFAGIPVVITEHNVDVWKKGIHRIIDKVLSPFASKVITVSDEVKKFYTDWGLPESKLVTVYNGVDVDTFSQEIDVTELKKTWSIGPDEIIIGWLGRMVPAKDLETLLLAFKETRESHTNARLLLVGDGPDKDDIVALGEKLEISDAIIYAGFQKKVLEFYHLMDLVVLSSTREGHPIVALEAMACARPMVATRVGGVPELVQDGVTGHIVPAQQPAAFAAALNKMLENSELRKQQGLAAQQLIRDKYSVHVMIKQHEDIYLAAI